MKQVNYYLRDENGFPKTTVTILEGEGIRARGVAFCNSCECFQKQEGRERSFLRAEKAMLKEKSYGKIGRPQVLRDAKFEYKCEYNPMLTLYEMELLSDPVK